MLSKYQYTCSCYVNKNYSAWIGAEDYKYFNIVCSSLVELPHKYQECLELCRFGKKKSNILYTNLQWFFYIYFNANMHIV